MGISAQIPNVGVLCLQEHYPNTYLKQIHTAQSTLSISDESCNGNFSDFTLNRRYIGRVCWIYLRPLWLGLPTLVIHMWKWSALGCNQKALANYLTIYSVNLALLSQPRSISLAIFGRISQTYIYPSPLRQPQPNHYLH